MSINFTCSYPDLDHGNLTEEVWQLNHDREVCKLMVSFRCSIFLWAYHGTLLWL